MIYRTLPASEAKIFEKLRLLMRRLLPDGSFIRDVSILASGTSVAQLIIIMSSPILSRLYTPSDFGVFAVFSSILALSTILSTFRYELAIPLPETEEDSLNLTLLSLLLLVGSTFIAATVTYYFGSKIFSPLGVSSLSALYLVLPIGIFGGGLFGVLNYLAIRSKRFSPISVAKVSQTVCGVAFQLFGFKLGHYGLMGGPVIGQVVSSLSLMKSLLTRDSFKQTSWHGVKEVFNRYRRFPIYSMPDAIANTASVQLPAVLFAYFFSPAAAGFYLLADRVLQLPASVIGSAVGQVFYGEAAAVRIKEELFTIVTKLYAQLANIGVVPLFLLILLGPELFAYIFGDEWRLAGELARYMAPWIFLVFVASPFTSLFGILEKQSYGMFFQFMVLGARAISLLIGGLHQNLTLAVALFSLVSVVFWVLFLFWVAIALRGDIKKLLSSSFTAMIRGVFAIFPLGLLFLLPQDAPYFVTVLICIFTFLTITRHYISLIMEVKR